MVSCLIVRRIIKETKYSWYECALLNAQNLTFQRYKFSGYMYIIGEYGFCRNEYILVDYSLKF